jgi:hypothetical protein
MQTDEKLLKKVNSVVQDLGEYIDQRKMEVLSSTDQKIQQIHDDAIESIKDSK